MLTPREFEVLDLVCDACLTNREIAEKLSIALSTVKKHRLRISARLRTHSQAELSKYYFTVLKRGTLWRI